LIERAVDLVFELLLGFGPDFPVFHLGFVLVHLGFHLGFVLDHIGFQLFHLASGLAE
jgi:hypothetical protein